MLVTMKEVLRIAAERKIAVGGFNCATLESARAAIGAAEELGLPFILQHAQVHDVYMPLRLAAPIMLALAKDASVPVCVHLDHGCDPDYVKKAIELGFTSIMYDASAKPYDVNLRETAEMASFAHAAGVSVEAELGRMPGGDEAVTPENCYTDPGEAAIFAAETGVDALAISFGTAHGVYKTTPKLFNSDLFPPEVQRKRVRKVMDNELTQTQRDVIESYFFENKTVRAIALEREVQPSSVSRAIKRGLRRMARCLRY